MSNKKYGSVKDVGYITKPYVKESVIESVAVTQKTYSAITEPKVMAMSVSECIQTESYMLTYL